MLSIHAPQVSGLGRLLALPKGDQGVPGVRGRVGSEEPGADPDLLPAISRQAGYLRNFDVVLSARTLPSVWQVAQ